MAENTKTTQFLNKVYSNAQMAADSISTVANKVQDALLLSDLQTQHQQYTSISTKATAKLSDEGQLPKDNGVISQTAAKGSIRFNTMFDKSPDHIAEMMIQGSVMGIIDMTRTLKQYNDIPSDIKALGYELVTVEENNVQRMKNYLG